MRKTDLEPRLIQCFDDDDDDDNDDDGRQAGIAYLHVAIPSLKCLNLGLGTARKDYVYFLWIKLNGSIQKCNIVCII